MDELKLVLTLVIGIFAFIILGILGLLVVEIIFKYILPIALIVVVIVWLFKYFTND